jgi:serine protease Do
MIMKNLWLRFVLAGCILFGLTGASYCGKDDSSNVDALALKRISKVFTDVSKKALPAVVFIEVEKTIEVGGRMGPRQYDPFNFFPDEFFERFFGPRRYKQSGGGSGFLISKDGYILTNNHVVGDADKITVTLHGGRKLPAKRIGSDPKSEVALIKIEGDNYPYLELGDSSTLEIGQWVIAVGNPFGLTETVTVGIISATGRKLGIAEYEYGDLIQTDAAINPGNSGGPLLDLNGKVIGINTAILSNSGGYMGIGFAVPINVAKAIAEQLMHNKKVVRGFLGIQFNPQEMDEKMAQSFGLKEPYGVLVADVLKDSPAEKAGLKPGDIILEVDGKRVDDNMKFRNTIALMKPGTKVTLTIFRDGTEKKINVEIGTYPEDERGKSASGSKIIENLGFSVRDLTPALARRFGYHFDEGVLIDSVQEGSPAENAGLEAGDLIVSVNRKPVKSAREFYEQIEKAGPKGILLHVKDQGGHSAFVVLLPP